MLQECSGSGFKIGMNWKRFYCKNVFEEVLLKENIGKDFTIRIFLFYFNNALKRVFIKVCIGKYLTARIHWRGFDYKNALERILL